MCAEETEKITIDVEQGELELTDQLLTVVAQHGQATGRYNFLPLDTIVALDELSQHYPGLRWILRKKRGDRYELHVFQSKHLELWESKGGP